MGKRKKQLGENRHPKKAAFLAALASCGNIGHAAEIAKCHRNSHYLWLTSDPTYKARYEAAMEQATDLLEQEARRRGLEGVDEPVFGSGGTGIGSVQVGVIRKYSDTLLIFLLKGARPAKYRERFEHSGPDGGPIVVKAEQLSDDELATIATRGSGRTAAAS